MKIFKCKIPKKRAERRERLIRIVSYISIGIAVASLLATMVIAVVK